MCKLNLKEIFLSSANQISSRMFLYNQISHGDFPLQSNLMEIRILFSAIKSHGDRIFFSAIKSHGDKNSFLCNQISWR
jgi:hypothetical protein